MEPNTLSKSVFDLVKGIYESNSKGRISDVTDVDGRPIGKENNFLFDMTFKWWHGQILLNSGEKKNFFIYPDGDGTQTAEFYNID